MFKFLGLIVLILAYISYKLNDVLSPPPLPPQLDEKWWGVGKPGSVKSNIKPFFINVSESDFLDFKYRLEHHRPLTPPLEGTQQQYGFNTNLLKEIIKYWKTKYDWRSREKYLNQFPQFIVNIQGLDIHYIHVKPKVPSTIKVLPLLISHGWPGSVREFYELIPILTTPQDGLDFVFEVIVPHIPGFGFSSPAARPGLSPDHIALVFKNLMNRLGFQKFYVQGGDFGSIILQNLAVLYPDSLLGFHSNMCYVATPLSFLKQIAAKFFPSVSYWYVRPDHYKWLFPEEGLINFGLRESGYLHLQASKPDTLGVGINDSPIGLAAYILEKFVTGTNRTWQMRDDECLLEYYTYDALLDNVMIYWFGKSATTSFRLYAETFNIDYFSKGILRRPIKVPTACVRFENDFYTPDGMIREIFGNLIQLTDYEGGHFAAMQLPKLFANDIYAAVKLIESKHQA